MFQHERELTNREEVYLQTASIDFAIRGDALGRLLKTLPSVNNKGIKVNHYVNDEHWTEIQQSTIQGLGTGLIRFHHHPTTVSDTIPAYEGVDSKNLLVLGIHTDLFTFPQLDQYTQSRREDIDNEMLQYTVLSTYYFDRNGKRKKYVELPDFIQDGREEIFRAIFPSRTVRAEVQPEEVEVIAAAFEIIEKELRLLAA